MSIDKDIQEKARELLQGTRYANSPPLIESVAQALQDERDSHNEAQRKQVVKWACILLKVGCPENGITEGIEWASARIAELEEKIIELEDGRETLYPEDYYVWKKRCRELEGALREVWKICRQCDFESAVSQVIPIAKNALGGSLRRK